MTRLFGVVFEDGVVLGNFVGKSAVPNLHAAEEKYEIILNIMWKESSINRGSILLPT
jgi:hypothetical protein